MQIIFDGGNMHIIILQLKLFPLHWQNENIVLKELYKILINVDNDFEVDIKQ